MDNENVVVLEDIKPVPLVPEAPKPVAASPEQIKAAIDIAMSVLDGVASVMDNPILNKIDHVLKFVVAMPVFNTVLADILVLFEGKTPTQAEVKAVMAKHKLV